jgi:hypothetical protein
VVQGTRQPNTNNKDKCFFAFAKQKLINCQTAFANAEAECPN